MNKDNIPSYLIFISKINVDEKIAIYDKSIHKISFYDRVKRTLFYNEGRHDTLKWIQDVIESAFSIYDDWVCDDDNVSYNENCKFAINILNDIQRSKDGIINMKTTYITDVYYCSLLDNLLRKIDIKVDARINKNKDETNYTNEDAQ